MIIASPADAFCPVTLIVVSWVVSIEAVTTAPDAVPGPVCPNDSDICDETESFGLLMSVLSNFDDQRTEIAIGKARGRDFEPAEAVHFR